MRKDGGYGRRHDLCAKSRDKLMMAMAMRGDGKARVKFSTPEDYKEGMQGSCLDGHGIENISGRKKTSDIIIKKT